MVKQHTHAKEVGIRNRVDDQHFSLDSVWFYLPKSGPQEDFLKSRLSMRELSRSVGVAELVLALRT